MVIYQTNKILRKNTNSYDMLKKLLIIYDNFLKKVFANIKCLPYNQIFLPTKNTFPFQLKSYQQKI